MQRIGVGPHNTHAGPRPTLSPKMHARAHTHSHTKLHLLYYAVAIIREFLLQLALKVVHILNTIEELLGLGLGYHMLQQHIPRRPFVLLQEVDLPRAHSIVSPNCSIHGRTRTYSPAHQHNHITPYNAPLRCIECE